MIRRSFRLGLTLGLVCGVAFALVKMLGGRSPRPAPATVPSQPWPPLRSDPVATGAAGAGPRPGTSAGATAPATTAQPQRPPAPTGGATGPQPAPGPQATRPRPPDEVVGPAAPAPAAGRTKKAPLKAAPAPAKKAPRKAKPTAAAGAAPKKAAKRAKKAAPATAWVVPEGDVCPTSHPVKAKMASRIFHVPGMLNYLRTRPDRCYVDAEAAEADGLRPAKR